MPILQFYISPNQLSLEEKQELASTLTARYARLMPDFFVNVMFHELPHGSFFVGGKPTDGKFVRVTAEHIAVNWNKDSKREKAYLDWLGGVLKERFEPKGWTWEFSVTESDRDLWRVQSIVPPAVGSQAMKTWVAAGKGIPWEAEKL
ncbi:uncharacterized protein LY89DRAFT_724452 [Mollisia scopiformis]|uniref:Tautomerase cis-CaaD-like domain-containing protein n=1 Tax=Mollisia scopiformis TaxID=149040 RepID=A0A132BB23_MOLSC|nr:uncharacterized protein LY89DRAFT_724452 [Mollisia scopiformis]KUJ09473.1 hypothetical protein LY89DRAFT_724452 [Mollisia scopiformis]